MQLHGRPRVRTPRPHLQAPSADRENPPAVRSRKAVRHEPYGHFGAAVSRRFLSSQRPTLPRKVLYEGYGSEPAHRRQILLDAPEGGTIQDRCASTPGCSELTFRVIHRLRLPQESRSPCVCKLLIQPDIL